MAPVVNPRIILRERRRDRSSSILGFRHRSMHHGSFPPGLDVFVKSMGVEASGVYSIELHPVGETRLPVADAGSHIDVQLPDGITRSYSIVNPRDETNRFIITVARDPNSQGGSRFLCEVLRPGDLLKISAPNNNFVLREDASNSVLIAGGIGVTPIWAMAQRLEGLGRTFSVFYASRTRESAAFVEPLRAMNRRMPGRVTIQFDEDPGQARLDLDQVIGSQPNGTHFYCCGPTSLLKSFEEKTAHLEPERVHIERFNADPVPASRGFEVVLAKSGKTYLIAPGATILETLLADGMNVSRACMKGVCGTCETGVLDGIPDHRDAVLSKRERASNAKIMICCSGSKSDRLVLDL
jgi:tetrachlorobenzoquinone reductase